MTDHVLGDGRLGNVDSEFEQFAVNSRSSPGGIIFAHGTDEIANLYWESSVSRICRAGISRSKAIGIPCDARR
jgi:hypothetical protein